MKILPVLDLKGGMAVHARGGQRHRYEPVHGVFGDGTDPVGLAEQIRARLGLNELYVADLDAITGVGNHFETVAELSRRGFRIWLDPGVRSEDDLTAVARVCPTVLIFALESATDLATVVRLREQWHGQQPASDAASAFSIDLVHGRPLNEAFMPGADPVELASAVCDAGFDRVILLDLAAVGRQRGVAVARWLAPIRARRPRLRVLGGGGVRGVEDLVEARRAGFDGLLIGTALHSGQIGPDELELVRG